VSTKKQRGDTISSISKLVEFGKTKKERGATSGRREEDTWRFGFLFGELKEGPECRGGKDQSNKKFEFGRGSLIEVSVFLFKNCR